MKETAVLCGFTSCVDNSTCTRRQVCSRYVIFMRCWRKAGFNAFIDFNKTSLMGWRVFRGEY